MLQSRRGFLIGAGSLLTTAFVTDPAPLFADMPKDAIDVAIGGKADMPFCAAYVGF
jgi:hypothetical protein